MYIANVWKIMKYEISCKNRFRQKYNFSTSLYKIDLIASTMSIWSRNSGGAIWYHRSPKISLTRYDFARCKDFPVPLFPRILIVPVRESDGSSCAVVRVAGLLFTSLLSPTSPLDVALACAKLRTINVATSEFFVNSQAVCLSLPMIRSLRCLRNAKGPSPSNSVEDSSRRFSSSLTCHTLRSFPFVRPLLSRFPRQGLPVKST